MNWPARIKDKGGLRDQFHHAIDIVPTILEAAGIPEPLQVNGVPQRPIEGVSMAYAWDDPKVKSRRVTQYFEMFGNRAVYHDGWVAGCRHRRLPWLTSATATFDDDTWELYNISEDFSQAKDLAKENPKKLRELQDLFMAEAAKYNVLPLDDRFAERAVASLRPSHLSSKKNLVYLPGTVRIPEPSAPDTKNVNHVLAAEIEIAEGGAEGVLVCYGGESGGYSLFVKDGKLHWEHNWFAESRYRVSSTKSLRPGPQIVSATIECDKEGKLGTGGKVTLRSGETIVAEGRFEKQIYARFTVNETFDVGCDTITPVSSLYESPFAFTGTIKRVMVDLSDRSFDELAVAVKAKMAMATQ